MPESNQSVQTLMLSLAEKAEERAEKPWYSCPACNTEWNRLRSCTYLDDSKQLATFDLCVNCAETLVAWEWLTYAYPLPPAFLTYIKWKGPRVSRCGKDEIIQARNAYVYVEVSGMEVVAHTEGTGRPIRYKIKGKDEVYTAENVFQLRSKFLHTLPY